MGRGWVRKWDGICAVGFRDIRVDVDTSEKMMPS